MSYTEQRKDPRWQKRRLQVLEAANWRCEDCNRADLTLDVHHTAYKTGSMPWEYPAELLMVDCEKCHEKRQILEDSIRIALGKITRFMTLEEIEKEVWEMVGQMSVRQTQRYAEAFTS
jgi:hypothetical protein